MLQYQQLLEEIRIVQSKQASQKKCYDLHFVSGERKDRKLLAPVGSKQQAGGVGREDSWATCTALPLWGLCLSSCMPCPANPSLCCELGRKTLFSLKLLLLLPQN